ncbi:MAG: adenosine deaminase [Bdellovibrionota bacterium]
MSFEHLYENFHFIKTLPKAELHVHLEGTLEPEMMFELAQRNRVTLPYKTHRETIQAYQFSNLQSFLDLYYQGTNVLLKKQDFYDLTYAYLKRAHADGVCHAEVFFDPQAHTGRGVDFETVFEGTYTALEQAKKDFKMSSYLIMCFLRHLPESDAIATLKQAIPYKKYIKAVGLDSTEIGNPIQKFNRVFNMALEQGFLTVAHAGEEGSHQNIWDALNMIQASRVDHGVRCLDDDLLVAELVEKQIPLTVCPVSNVKLKVFNDYATHNIKEMFQKGVCVTINSDDPAYFRAYIAENYALCQKYLDFTNHDLVQIAKNSFAASFLPEVEKQKNYDKLLEFSQEQYTNNGLPGSYRVKEQEIIKVL